MGVDRPSWPLIMVTYSDAANPDQSVVNMFFKAAVDYNVAHNNSAKSSRLAPS